MEKELCVEAGGRGTVEHRDSGESSRMISAPFVSTSTATFHYKVSKLRKLCFTSILKLHP